MATEMHEAVVEEGVGLPAEAPQVRLTCGLGTAAQKTWKLHRLVTLLGDRRQAHIRLHDPEVSKAHCVIVHTGSDVLLADLASRSGTYLNDARVSLTPVADGDVIRVGPYQMQLAITSPDDGGCDTETGLEYQDPLRLELPCRLVEEGSGREWVLERRVSLLGSREGADVRLEHGEVSAAHAIVFSALGRVFVFDLGSRGGTAVNGRAVRLAEVGDGDVVAVGPFALRVVLGGEAGGAQATLSERPAAPRAPAGKDDGEAGAAGDVPGGAGTERAGGAASAEVGDDSPTAVLDQLEARIAALQNDLSAGWQRLGQWKRELEERERELSQWAEQIRRQRGEHEQRAEALSQREAELEASAQRVQQQRSELDAKSKGLSEREGDLSRREAALAEQEERIAQERSALAREREELASRAAALEAREKELAQRQREWEAQAEAVREREAALEQRSKEVEEYAAALEKREREIDARAEEVAQREAALAVRERELTSRAAELKQTAAELAERQAELRRHVEGLQKREESLEAFRAALQAAWEAFFGGSGSPGAGVSVAGTPGVAPAADAGGVAPEAQSVAEGAEAGVEQAASERGDRRADESAERVGAEARAPEGGGEAGAQGGRADALAAVPGAPAAAGLPEVSGGQAAGEQSREDGAGERGRPGPEGSLDPEVARRLKVLRRLAPDRSEEELVAQIREEMQRESQGAERKKRSLWWGRK